jgi:hypothetical protein
MPQAWNGPRFETEVMSTNPRQAVTDTRLSPVLARGADERFTGYGAMGVPYASRHYLAFRDMLVTSLGKPYRAIWHRDPAGRWTIFTTIDPDLSCPRYFGSMTAAERVAAIEVSWPDERTIDVAMGSRLSWRMVLTDTPATRAMSAMATAMPQWCWNSNAVLAPMGLAAGGALRSGRMRLQGRTPNGQGFKAAPFRVWRVTGGRAALDGVDLGAPEASAGQTRLEDFWLPTRGLFFVGQARFTPSIPSPHSSNDALAHLTTERKDHDRSAASTHR